ncbi:MAG: hypothetical protein ACRDG5_00585, partial [Anaerolineales bacterium]
RRADQLARASADLPINKPITPGTVRHKLTKQTTAPGSVGMDGQRITIRIVDSEFQRAQRVWRYRFEVVSQGRPYRGLMDFACSTKSLLLKPGHTYRVRFGSEQGNPTIEKLFGEVLPQQPRSPGSVPPPSPLVPVGDV